MAQKSFNHISEAVKLKINDAITATGLTDKDWIERAIDVWSLHAMKTEIPDFRMEIEEVEGLTNRIRNVMVNLAQRTAFDKDDARRKWEVILEEKRQEIENLHNYQIQLEKDVKNANEEVQRMSVLREESEKYAKQVDEASASNKALAESYKEKNETLTSMMTEYKAGHDAATALREQLSEANRDKRELDRQVTEERENLEALTKVSEERIRLLEERFEEQKQRYAERHQGELDKKDIENERALLKLRTELQEQATIEIRGLYGRIEQSRNEHDQNVEYIRKDYDKRTEALQMQMEAMKADYDRQIAELKNPPKK